MHDSMSAQNARNKTFAITEKIRMIGNHVMSLICVKSKMLNAQRKSTRQYYTRRTPTTTLNDDIHDCLKKEQRLRNGNRTKQILIPPNYSIVQEE